MANLAMITGNVGRAGVGVNPLRGQNNVQGSNDVGSFPHELTGYRHVSDPKLRAEFESEWHVTLDPEPGLRIPNMFDAALDGSFKGIYIEGEDIAQSDPNSQHVAAALQAMEIVIVQDIFLNETAKFAHVFLPGSSFLEKNGTFTNAERRISPVRKVLHPLAGKEDWEVTCMLSNALGYPMKYEHPSEIMDEIARLTPTFAGVSYEKLDRIGSAQWPCNDAAPEGTQVMHVGEFVRGKGRLLATEYVPTDERTTQRYPLILTTGRILTQYNVGTQTRRTQERRLACGGRAGDSSARCRTALTSRGRLGRGDAAARDRYSCARSSPSGSQPGVVYTTFHHPDTGANVVTTENSDWATNCPEYKVTAVQVMPTSRRPERTPPERIVRDALTAKRSIPMTVKP